MKKLLLSSAVGLGVLCMASFDAPAHATPTISDTSIIWTTSPNPDPMLSPYAVAKANYYVNNPGLTPDSISTSLDFYRYWPQNLPGYQYSSFGNKTVSFSVPAQWEGYHFESTGEQYGQSASHGQGYYMEYRVNGSNGGLIIGMGNSHIY